VRVLHNVANPLSERHSEQFIPWLVLFNSFNQFYHVLIYLSIFTNFNSIFYTKS